MAICNHLNALRYFICNKHCNSVSVSEDNSCYMILYNVHFPIIRVPWKTKALYDVV